MQNFASYACDNHVRFDCNVAICLLAQIVFSISAFVQFADIQFMPHRLYEKAHRVERWARDHRIGEVTVEKEHTMTRWL